VGRRGFEMVASKKKPVVLDMGAGINPHPKATHAVDVSYRPKNIKHAVETYGSGLTTVKKLENKLKSVDYKFNFNYNMQKLPWPSNHFDMIYSNGSLGANGKSFAYKEIYRVLKHGGKLSFGQVGDTIEKIEKIIHTLKEIGFVKVRVVDFGSYMYKGVKRYTGWVKASKGF
jgi:SAM-dependent methyltransferase